MENSTSQTMGDKQELIKMDIKNQCVSAFEKAYEHKLSNSQIRDILLSAKQEAMINDELRKLGLLGDEASDKDIIEATSEISKNIINEQEESDEIKKKAIEHIESVRSDRMLVATTNPDMLASDVFRIYQKNEFLKDYVTASVLNALVRNAEKSNKDLETIESDYTLVRDNETNAIIPLSKGAIEVKDNAKFTALTVEESIDVEVLDNIDYELGWKEQLKIEHKKDMLPVVYMDFDKRASELDDFVRNMPTEDTYIIQPEIKAQEPKTINQEEEVDNGNYELKFDPTNSKTYTLDTKDIIAFIKDEEQLTFPYPQGFLSKNNLRILRLDLMDLPLKELKDLLQKMQEKNEKLEEKQKLELINSLTSELTSNAGVKNEQDEPASKENESVENQQEGNSQKNATPTEENLNKLKGIYDDSREELEALSKRIDDTSNFNPGENYELSEDDEEFLKDIDEDEEDDRDKKRREEEQRRADSASQRKKSAHNVK